MELPPLTQGVIIRRYKRFLADVELLDGSLVVVHCPNTGRMTGCWEPGAVVEISHSDNPKRKLAWTLERVDMGQGWVGIHTGRTNGVVAEAIVQGKVPMLAGYSKLTREVKLELPGHPPSRLDLLLSEHMSAPNAWVEVKNATLLEGDSILFPDAVSERATKHIDLLRALVERGERGIILYAINRPEGSRFSPAREIDPVYASHLEQALNDGVEAVALRIQHTRTGMEATGLLPVQLGTP
ncbi:MAG: DNA/RNA nuclease SfsA [Gammaproteobacteria bacterium]|nr:DNA/RNA nuclease SfsA [Gammaproteobacteria bacterium]